MTWVLISVLPVLLVCSGFFSGSETALFSLSAAQRTDLGRGQPSRAATMVRTLLAETRSLLITLLMGNMVINVLYFVVSSVIVIRNEQALNLVAVIALTISPLVVLILFGEVLPKLVAARLSMRWSLVCAPLLLLIHRFITPVRLGASAAIITPLARLIAPRDPVPQLTENELEHMLSQSQTQGVIDSDEERLLQQVLALRQVKVRNLMIPRVDVLGFDLDEDPEALMRLIDQTRLRHVPAYRGDLDTIEGVIYSRDALLERPQTPQALQALVRPARFVPEQQRADGLLIDLRAKGGTFAVVVDEYGGTAGLITLEDLVEHMVGGLPASYEGDRRPQVIQDGPNRWRVDADLSVHHWPELFGRYHTPDDAATLAAVSTVGGLVTARLGRAPRKGDHLEMGNIRFDVEKVAGNRIETILIELISSSEAAARAEAQALADTDRGGSEE